MGKTTAGDPDEIVRLAGEILTTVTELTDVTNTAQPSMTVSAADFGNSGLGSRINDTYQDTIESGTGASSLLQTVLTNDIDGLQQTAFTLQDTDAANANRLERITLID